MSFTFVHGRIIHQETRLAVRRRRQPFAIAACSRSLSARQRLGDGCFCFCRLALQEALKAIADHTAKDLAGRHVCLALIQAILDGKEAEDRKFAWRQWHERRVSALEADK